MNELKTPNQSLDELKERLLNSENKMIVFPTVATEAIELTSDPCFSMAEFSCLVERDAKLTTDLLSLANSPLFNAALPVSSIHQSIVRLGMRQCRNLILSACVKSMMQKISLEQEWIRDLLWQHSFTTASACLYLNRTFSLGFQGEEFTAGLLHDIGRTLFAIVKNDDFQIADPLNFKEDEDLLTRETEVMGTNHCEFGAWFTTHNKLPDEITEVIRWHHEPTRKSRHQKLIALVAAGDHVANHIQVFEEAAGYVPEENKAISILSQLYDKNFDENFSEIAPQLVTDVRDMATVNTCCKQRAV